ncbi:hypothetical protein [Acinetobacter sp. WCHAc010052]|uniref:hypothetical protein n=1 Tax=Acinetobacter sp. WCHAc010052 TaxID=2004647 RepID=UPI000B3C3721|nr:hypothetical protein [Acinetobacter sp. WCHAc010052]AXY60227.1 hypothetical protein CDG61_09435 [Acinetobacter sp. WCHAc010052]
MDEKNYQIQPVDIPEDLNSCWFHPDIAEHDTIDDGAEYYTKEQWEQLQKNLSVEIIYHRCEYEDIPEIPKEDSSDWSKWKPTAPKEGLFLIAAFDTEDGPVLWWAKQRENK